MELHIDAFFKDIQNTIISDIQNAHKEIMIAVAWFTNKKIFSSLLEKLDDGIKVKLIVINDNINIRKFGIDFQDFVTAGGELYFAEKNIPMHNKYIIIDDNVVITGSYNYTYLAETVNDENILRLSGASDVVNAYVDDFNSLLSILTPVSSVNKYLEENPPFSNVFAFSNYGIRDIYQQAIIIDSGGNKGESQELVNYIDSCGNSQKMSKDFLIRNVIYRQWKNDYFADRIVVKDGFILVKFRTHVSDGCWICSPNTKWCWILRDSMNNNSYLPSNKICNISINKKILVKEARKKCIYYIGNKEKVDFSDNNCGYEVNENKKMIDEKGEIVPLEFIKIEGKSEMTCEVYFEDKEYKFTNKMVDFIEGIDCEKMENHWHCFEINLKLHREPI